MFAYIWPIGLVVLSNIVYHICAKSVPAGIDPFATLTITYIIGAIVAGILYFVFNKHGNLLKEYQQLNWAPFVLGIVIVGLEVGFIFAYKNGWQVNMASIVESTFLAIALIFVGKIVFNEGLNVNKIIGIVICLVGLYFINK